MFVNHYICDRVRICDKRWKTIC